MTTDVDTLLYSALSAVVTPCVPGKYLGDKTEYLEYRYYAVPYDFSDDKPNYELYRVFVGYYNRAGVATVTKRNNIKRALFDAGFTFPEEENASEGELQQFIFECLIAHELDLEGGEPDNGDDDI